MDTRLSDATVVIRNPDQVSGEIDGQVVLLSVASGKYFKMDPVGSRIWALLETPMRVDALCGRLTSEFAVDGEACARDTSQFLDELLQSGLLQIVEP